MTLPPKLTKADLLAYLSEKGVRAECYDCQRNDWAIWEDVDGTTVVLNVLGPARTGPVGNPIIPVMIMACNHCGAVRIYTQFLVEKWKEQRGK